MVAQEQLLQALMSWRYPDAGMEPAVVASLGAVRAGLPVMAYRRATWAEAARCLLGAVRSGGCDAFYFISPSVRAPLHSALMNSA